MGKRGEKEIMQLNEYKKLVRIRILMDENPTKAKQLLTDLITKFELEKYKADELN